MKNKYIDKPFYDLTVEEIREMRRSQGKSIPIEDFLKHYEITAVEYCDTIRDLDGIAIARDERKAFSKQKDEENKFKPKDDYTFRVENLPNIFVAAMYQVDFEVVNGRRLYDLEELERAREDIRKKVDNYERLIRETTDKTAYSKLKGIDLKAMRIYRGKNTMSFSKMSRMRVSEIKYYESLNEKIPKYVETIYREHLNIKKRHIIQLREIMEGKSDKVVEDREIPKLVKLRVYQRDKGKCTECEKKEELHFHHIKYFSEGGQHEVNNLKLLCRGCHAEVHKGEKVYNMLKGR
ncbi:HNH endonuclease [Ornithinibacillus xuwenensis]|uniref:HNH endonuclease signature motif containing protein n=1 Tax=Ornithinibacillus xuwenensis TaxID=3144668 RepID=A0ABU9XBZ0_9BACI